MMFKEKTAMRTLTWTAVLAGLIALPLVMRKRKRAVVGLLPEAGGDVVGEVLRYDIDDLLT